MQFERLFYSRLTQHSPLLLLLSRVYYYNLIGLSFGTWFCYTHLADVCWHYAAVLIAAANNVSPALSLLA
jgi:hypothetical protein